MTYKFGNHLTASAALRWIISGVPPTLVALTVIVGGIFSRSMQGWQRGIFTWTHLPAEPKFIFILSYLVMLLGIFACVILFLFVRRYAEILDRRLPPTSERVLQGGVIISIFFAGSAIFLQKVYSYHPVRAEVCLLFGIATLTLPYFQSLFFRLPITHLRLRWAILPFLIAVAPLVVALAITPYRIPNEFLSLPEETIFPDGSHIDNISYINQHDLEGLQIPDPRDLSAPQKQARIGLKSLRPAAKIALEALARYSQDHLWFDQENNQIEIHYPLNSEEFYLLEKDVTTKDLSILQDQFSAHNTKNVHLDWRHYDNQENLFLKYNRDELENALILGHFFYHQVFLFPQAAAFATDGTIPHASQYGRGLTEAIGTLLTFIPKTSWFNAYLATIYSGYPIYLALITVIAISLGLPSWGIVFIAGATVLTYLLPELNVTRLGEGLSPWRHLFDVIGFFTLHRYVRRPAIWSAVFVVLMIAIAVYWSREAGFFLSVSLLGGLVLTAILQFRQTRRRMALTVATAFAGLATLAWAFSAGNTNTQGHLAALLYGINTPDLYPGMITAASLFFSVSGIVWWRLRIRFETTDNAMADWMTTGATLAYCAGATVYFIWYPSAHHLVLMLPAGALMLVLLYRNSISIFPNNSRIAATALTILLSLMTLLGAQRIREFRSEDLIFRTHSVYEWSMPAGHIETTAQPALVKQAIDLIQRYENGTYVNILSPWEILVLPLSGKAKDGPYTVSFDSLLFKADEETLRRSILSSNSPILFADTRLMRGEYEGTLSSAAVTLQSRIQSETSRISAHAGLRRVFETLRPCYDLIEEGPLLTVYHRKGPGQVDAARCPGIPADQLR